MPGRSGRRRTRRRPTPRTAPIPPSSYTKYGVDFDGNGHVDLRHSVPDVLASTANLLKVNGWERGQPFDQGTRNFEVMREWNRSEVYRRALVYFSQQLHR